ncbi:uncharacterized protein [Alexandromys fortis]|uniref:uncharacterized protein n=1 Tax=Alexandromys fortis TaxID=100897 RepID=UPI00215216B6|nr:uncharacterized protein LOC126506887 [Microtus fortis]
MCLCESREASLGAQDRRPGVMNGEKGSLLTRKTTMASVSRMQPDKAVPVEPGYLQVPGGRFCCYIKNQVWRPGGWWRTPLIPALGRQRQADLCHSCCLGQDQFTKCSPDNANTCTSSWALTVATCLLISLRKQLPEVSRMAVNRMPLQSHLSLSVSPPTFSSPLSHITPCLQEATRLELAPLYPRSLKCLVEGLHLSSLAPLHPKSL